MRDGKKLHLLTLPLLGFLAFWPPFQLAKLSEIGTCRATYELKDGARLCIGAEAWRNWLSSPNPEKLPGQNFRGRWRAYSPLENTPGADIVARKHSLLVLKWDGEPENAPPSPWARVQRAIERKREVLSDSLRAVDERGVFRALLLSEETRTDFRFLSILGFVHLASASGIHLLFLAETLRILFLKISPLIAGEEVAIPAATFLSIFVGGWAWCLGGARTGMLIAWILFTIRSMARNLGLKSKFSVLFMVAAALTFLLKGQALFALAWLGASSMPDALASALGAWSILSLWQSFQTGLINGLTPLWSVLLIPVIAGVFYPILVFFSLSPAFGFMRFFSPLFDLFNQVIGSLVEFDLHLSSLWIIPKTALLIGAWISFLLLPLPANFRRRAVMILPLIGVIIAIRVFTAESVVTKVEQLDVGQGDAALVTSRDSSGLSVVGLIDTGAVNALQREDWIQLFSERGLDHLDWIALTHLDADHAGGARTLSETLPVKCIETSKKELESPRGRALSEFMAPKNIAVTQWGSACVPFPTFAPPAGSTGPNANMGAILVPLSGASAYVSMGDAEGEDEMRLASRIQIFREKSGLSGELALKLSHHGSRTSSSESVLRRLSPRVAIISAGIGNTYGHPSEEVLMRSQDLGIAVFRTDQLGSVDAGQALKAEDARRRPQTRPR